MGELVSNGYPINWVTSLRKDKDILLKELDISDEKKIAALQQENTQLKEQSAIDKDFITQYQREIKDLSAPVINNTGLQGKPQLAVLKFAPRGAARR